MHGNPYDGHTLTGVFDQIKRLTGITPKEAYCDQGYRGHGYAGETVVHVVDRKRKVKSRSARKWRNRRAAVEPVIGHLKHDHRMECNYLKGRLGDRLNALLSGCGRNLRKLLQSYSDIGNAAKTKKLSKNDKTNFMVGMQPCLFNF